MAGNWKLHNTLAEARALASQLRQAVPADSVAEVAVAPVFTALSAVAEILVGSPIAHAAQDVYWESQGAYTGEVSAPLLADLGCRYVIVGHSERRQLFGETDDHVRRKAAAVLASDMAPIVCVGESLEQRESGEAENHVAVQVERAFEGLDEAYLGRVVVAYEPIWAIGTGRTASPDDAQRMHAHIREQVSKVTNARVAANMRILYGGSVKPANAASLLQQRDLDGVLVGGASLDAPSFLSIVAAAEGQAQPSEDR